MDQLIITGTRKTGLRVVDSPAPIEVLDEAIWGHGLEVRRQPLREATLPDCSVFDSPEQGPTNF